MIDQTDSRSGLLQTREPTDFVADLAPTVVPMDPRVVPAETIQRT
jgi:hypothetical protein